MPREPSRTPGSPPGKPNPSRRMCNVAPDSPVSSRGPGRRCGRNTRRRRSCRGVREHGSRSLPAGSGQGSPQSGAQAGQPGLRRPGAGPADRPGPEEPVGRRADRDLPAVGVRPGHRQFHALLADPPGSAAVAKSATVRVTLPGSVAGPSGVVANPGTGFVLANGTVSAPAAFIFDTLDGHIEAWSPKVDPLIGNTEDKVTVPGAAYTGLAVAGTGRGERLFAADFAKGTVDVFDSAFHQVKLASWQFSDDRLPRGYVPFNAHALDGRIFVTYDTPDPATHWALAGSARHGRDRRHERA